MFHLVIDYTFNGYLKYVMYLLLYILILCILCIYAFISIKIYTYTCLLIIRIGTKLQNIQKYFADERVILTIK